MKHGGRAAAFSLGFDRTDVKIPIPRGKEVGLFAWKMYARFFFSFAACPATCMIAPAAAVESTWLPLLLLPRLLNGFNEENDFEKRA